MKEGPRLRGDDSFGAGGFRGWNHLGVGVMEDDLDAGEEWRCRNGVRHDSQGVPRTRRLQ